LFGEYLLETGSYGHSFFDQCVNCEKVLDLEKTDTYGDGDAGNICAECLEKTQE